MTSSFIGRSTALATLAAVLTSDPEPFRHAGPLAPVIAGLLDKDPARRTDAVRARKQLGEVATLWERDAHSTVAPFPAVHVTGPATDPSPTGPTEADRRSTGNRFQDGAGFVPIRQRMTGRRRLSVGVVALAVGLLTGTIVAGGWRGDEPGRSERDAPSGAAPVTTSQPTRTPEARQVTDERRSTSASRRGGRADVAPRATATGSPGPGASETGARESNPNSNKDKGKKYGVTQHGDGKKD